MSSRKRKSFFKNDYAKEFQGITQSKAGEEYAHCIPCKFDISLTSTGKHAITHHQKTEKHQKAAKAARVSGAITAFMPSTSVPTNLDRQTAAAEGTFAYHIARHAQSFKSADCSSELLHKICPDSKIAEKFSSTSKKTAAIIKGVLAPYSVEAILTEIKGKPFSISIDSSNHKTLKLFPLIIRYFSTSKGIQVKLIDLEELGGETAAEIYEWIIKILQKHNLMLEDLVAFCGDNVNANFGGAELAGERNVFSKLRNRGNLIPIGCPSHVLHNAARNSADNLPFDIEAIVFKISSHFRNSTKRVGKLKEICEEFETNYSALNTHGQWTTLQLIVTKMLKCWDVYRTYFETDGPLFLRNFFASDIAHTMVTFLSVILPTFNHSIDKLQRNNAILPELIDEMNGFRRKIEQRYEEKFYGMITGQMLRKLPEHSSEELRRAFQNFLHGTLLYVDKWFRIERFPTELEWTALKEQKVDRADVMSLAEQIAPEMDDNQLFDEVTLLNEVLLKIPGQKFLEMSAEEKWLKIFEAKLPNVEKLISQIFSVPVSNASVERVFSLCSAQWTDTRNLLKVNTVKCLAQVKINYDLNCAQMYDLIISTPKLLKQIMENEKYNV